VRQPTKTRSVSEIPNLLAHLSSRSYERRLRGTSRLMEFGPEAYAHLERAFRNSDSPEVRCRIERIAQHIYLRELSGEGEGFLGISPHAVTADHDARLKPGETGIVVRRVFEGTAAERVGLQVDDVIVRFDDALIAVDASGEGFSGIVRRLRPGTVVPIEIQRGDERIRLRVRLSARPEAYDHAADREEAEARCRRWFRDHFERPVRFTEDTATVRVEYPLD
jgi:C-terminal processing protease CtpA/Prc